MKSNSSIPTWTLIRQITFAKSATSKFFPFNKKAFRGIDYSSSFLFLLIGSSKMKVNLLLRLLFPQQMQILTVETHLVVQPNQTQEYFERQTLSRSPIFVLHIVEDYPSLWSTVSFWHRIHQLTTLIWRILITLFFKKKSILYLGRHVCIKVHLSERSGSFGIDFSEVRIASIIFLTLLRGKTESLPVSNH